jgi:hypothetical protein
VQLKLIIGNYQTSMWSNARRFLTFWCLAMSCAAVPAAFGSADGDDAPSSRGSYLSAASGRARRGVGGVDGAEIVLAVINSTRQRASKLSGRSRHVSQLLSVPNACIQMFIVGFMTLHP